MRYTVTCRRAPLRTRISPPPSSPYSASKAAADLLVGSYVRTYGFPALITRPSNNYGPYQFPEKFLPLMITRALASEPLPVYGDGRQQRNWLHVEDNCRGLMAVLERGQVGEVYNLGGADVLENIELAARLLTLMGKPQSSSAMWRIVPAMTGDTPWIARRWRGNWTGAR